MKTYTTKTLKKAPAGFYWVKLPSEDWDIGHLRTIGRETLFAFTPPRGYFGGGQSGPGHEVLSGAIFAGPLAEPGTEWDVVA